MKRKKNSTESDMLVPLDEDMSEKGEYIMMDTPRGHGPYLRDEDSSPGLKETEDEEHSLFFGPAYPRNVRKYYKIIAQFQRDATIIYRDSNVVNEFKLWLVAKGEGAMTAEKLLVKLLEDVENLSDQEYEKLTTITEKGNQGFISLSERTIQNWIDYMRDKK